MTRAFANEFAKMRHLHVGPLMAALFMVVTGVGLSSALSSPDFGPANDSSWNTLLGSFGSGFTLAAPLLIAVVASRLVDVEHQGGGWLLSATSGLAPGRLCRAKLLALGIPVTAVTLLASAVFVGTGLALGVSAPWPAGRWIGLTVCVLAVNLVVLTLHVLLAARVENQLVGMGIGLLGTVLALFGAAVPAWVAHSTPWGHYALSAASEYVDEELVARSPDYPSVTALCLVATIVFALFTRSFDRQEA